MYLVGYDLVKSPHIQGNSNYKTHQSGTDILKNILYLYENLTISMLLYSKFTYIGRIVKIKLSILYCPKIYRLNVFK